MEKLSHASAWPVHGRAAIQALQGQLQTGGSISLMEKAGLATAQLAMAVAPHAQRIWVAAGPGHNGGDGLQAALHLHQWGKPVIVSLMGPGHQLPTQAQAAWQRAQAAGVQITSGWPEDWLSHMGPQDLCVDALLGLGASRPLSADMQMGVQAINRCRAQVLAIDVPTGLNPATGQWLGGCMQHGTWGSGRSHAQPHRQPSRSVHGAWP